MSKKRRPRPESGQDAAPRRPAHGGAPSSRDLLALAHSRRYRPMTVDDMAAHFGLAGDDALTALAGTVRALELSGDLVEVKAGCLAAPEKLGVLVGRLNCNARGFGFVSPLREKD
ncbi:MAG TPA: hypothetical protein P5137_15955, partial [Candidatus Brocadiia bacterium]|nr:hypothetical protein [Candidatus Brocadiia bacterium]